MALKDLQSLLDECQAILRPKSERGEGEKAAGDDASNALAVGAVRLADFVAPDEALPRLDLAAEALRELGNPDLELRGSVALKRVRLRARMGRVDAALEILREELEACGDARYHGPILHAEFATLARATGDFRSALDSLALAENALQDRASVLPIVFHATTRCEIAGERGQIYLDLGRADLAAPQFEVEKRLAEESGAPATRFASILHRVHLHLTREDDRAALLLIDAAKADSSWLTTLGDGAIAALDVRAAQATARAAIDDPSRIEEASRRAAVAMTWARRSDVLTEEDRVLAHLAAARIALLNDDVVAPRALLDDARRLLDETLQRPPSVLEAQWNVVAAELARRRATTPNDIEARAAVARLRRAVDGVLVEWDAAPRIPAGLGFFHFASRCELIVEAIRAEAALDSKGAGDERALELVFAIDARSRLGGGVPATLAGLRAAALGDDETLCVWLPSPESTQLFVVTKKFVKRFDLAGITQLRKAAEAFDDVLDSGVDDRAAGRALFDALVPSKAWPLIATARHLTVSGLDSLGAPAIEASRRPDGEILGTSQAICRVPSLSWLDRRARATEPKHDRDLLLLAAPTCSAATREGHPEFAQLVLADARADETLALYGDAELITGDRATLEGLRRALARPPVVLEFFTHGFLEPSDPRPARLVLARSEPGDEGDLTCDIAETLPPADLVVLAACRSGIGPLHRGDAGAADLTGAFLLGGARAVISANSDVRAGPAAAFLLEAEQRMGRGEAPSVALAGARAWLLNTRNEWDSIERRRVVARFHLDGLGHRPLTFEARSTAAAPVWKSVPLIAILVVGAIAGVLWIARQLFRRRS